MNFLFEWEEQYVRSEPANECDIVLATSQRVIYFSLHGQ